MNASRSTVRASPSFPLLAHAGVPRWPELSYLPAAAVSVRVHGAGAERTGAHPFCEYGAPCRSTMT
jgi:hypothetical protein